MEWQPGQADGAGADPNRPDGMAAPDGVGASGEAVRDRRLAGFARGGEWDTRVPSASLTVVAEAVSGPEWRCPGATDDELAGVLRRWAALESWAAAGKLGVVREMMRREYVPGMNRHGDLPDACTDSLKHELAGHLAMSTQSSENLAWLAFELRVRLPRIGALLADGTLTFAKARAVAETFMMLSDDDAAAAEALIVGEAAGKTYGQLLRLAAQAAVTVDPESARKRREHAERENSRVRLWREQSGAVGLSGHDLPADEALAAYANVTARADEYKKSKAFPDARMDQLRAMAYLDLLNGVTAQDRIAHALAMAETAPGPGPGSQPEHSSPASAGTGSGTDPCDCPCRECDGSCLPPAEDDLDPGDAEPLSARDADGSDDRESFEDSGPDDTGEPGGNGGPDDGGDGPGPDGGPTAPSLPDGNTAAADRPPVADLVIPLATLLGLAERPGAGHGLGPLDPDLCRDLAATAARYLASRWCVTVTDPDGIAIGHGCARSAIQASVTARGHASGQAARLTAFPARVNLTIPATFLAAPSTRAPLSAEPSASAVPGPQAPGSWAFTPRDDPGPPGGYGTWTLTLPDGREFTVRLEPVPTYTCDHAHESHGYQPNDTLRHLVQVRDGDCTFPPCSRHARESDFEHALPYDKGGRTCACNAGARSRACHRVKQSPGWNVTQPKPGWHQWTTPSGRVYTQGPKRYPA